MECFVLFIIAAIVLLSLTPIGEGLRTGHPRIGSALRKLATKYNGTFRGSGIYMAPSVRIRYGQTWITISSTMRRGTGMTTRAEIDWPDDELQLDLRTRGRRVADGDGADEMAGHTTGDEEFDHLFLVRTNHPDRAKVWLSEAVRWQLIQLATTLGRQPQLIVTLENRILQIEKSTAIHRFDDMEQFYLLAGQLYDQAMLTRATGIDFLRESEAQPIEAPICKVCGEPIESDMVVCRRCRTPYHLDCWQYAGKCSVFGCPETHYVVPTVARSPEPPEDSD